MSEPVRLCLGLFLAVLGVSIVYYTILAKFRRRRRR